MDNQGEDVGVVVYTAGQAAQQLEVSASGLRRLANAYEAVFGVLPRDPGTRARGYPQEAVERLRAARRGVETGQYKSTAAALGALKRGVTVDTGVEMAGGPDDAAQGTTGQALGVLAAEMRAMEARINAKLDRLIAAEERDLPQLPPATPSPETEHGPLVKVAMWLEQVLRRSR